MALSTGLRASELASLRPESLLLLEDPPTVTVKAGYSKRRRMDVLPLPSEILETVRLWLGSKPAGQPLWPGDWASRPCPEGWGLAARTQAMQKATESDNS